MVYTLWYDVFHEHRTLNAPLPHETPPMGLASAGPLLRTVQNKYLWLTISLMVYTFGISGGVYDIIRNPLLFTVKQDGTVLWFHPQVREHSSRRPTLWLTHPPPFPWMNYFDEKL